MDGERGPVGYLSRTALEALEEVHIRHPLNPASDVFLRRLAPVFGLKRLALYLARVPPGKESFACHRHYHDEEFLMILSGRGRAEIGDHSVEVGPGDVMGFTAPDGPPHHLTNPYRDDLIYLMGGESSGFDVAQFPKTGQHLVFAGTTILLLHDATLQKLCLNDWMAASPGRAEGEG